MDSGQNSTNLRAPGSNLDTPKSSFRPFLSPVSNVIKLFSFRNSENPDFNKI